MYRRHPYWLDGLLVVVTLGLYAPFWLWRRNEDLQEDFRSLSPASNGALLLVAVLLGLLDPVFELGGARFLASVVLVVAVLLFSAGVFILLRNAETAAEAHGLPWRAPPALVSGLVLATFLAVEAGNVLGSWTLRGLALVLLGSIPFAFYYVHEDLEAVHERGRAIRTGALPP